MRLCASLKRGCRYRIPERLTRSQCMKLFLSCLSAVLAATASSIHCIAAFRCCTGHIPVPVVLPAVCNIPNPAWQCCLRQV